jgi:rhodanese-related sulfurtransferase
MNMKVISRNELKSKLDHGESITLLETLPEEYYHRGHLPGARPFPHDQASKLATRMLPKKDAPVVLYCWSSICTRSYKAAEILEALGYTNVSVYIEGKADWRTAGLPFER